MSVATICRALTMLNLSRKRVKTFALEDEKVFFSVGIATPLLLLSMRTAFWPLRQFWDRSIQMSFLHSSFQLLPAMNAWPAPRSVLVLDGASIHDQTALKDLMQQTGCKLSLSKVSLFRRSSTLFDGTATLYWKRDLLHQKLSRPLWQVSVRPIAMRGFALVATRSFYLLFVYFFFKKLEL